MPKKKKRLTKRERKALFGKGPSGSNPNQDGHAQHIHCIACGRHVDPGELSATPPTATVLTCEHGSQFASCTGCVDESQRRIDEHDRTGKPPQVAQAWH
jgi:hypothetical protein